MNKLTIWNGASLFGGALSRAGFWAGLLFLTTMLSFGKASAQYCTSNATSTADSRIASVTVDTMTVSSPVGSGNCVTYTDYSAGTVFQIYTGAPTSFEVVYGTCNGNYASYAKIWIDRNNDSIFDANEMMAEGNIAAGTNLTGSFQVPLIGSVTGNVRMRVVMREGGNTTTTQACGTFSYGETQDFTVNLQPASGCLAVFNPVATVLSDTTASLAWTEQGTASEWHIEYGVAGFTPGTGAVFNTTTNPHTVSSLMPGTTYDWYVSAVCGGVLSPASAGSSFTTQCSFQMAGSYTIDANATPSATTFTSFSAFADQLNLCGVSGPVTVTVAPNSGPYNEQVYISPFAGRSATNPVTIFGNGNEIAYLSTNTSERATLKIEGSSHVTINDLSITALGSSNGEYGFAVQIMGGAQYITFENCNIQATQSTFSTNFVAVVVSNNSTNASSANYAADNLTISNSSITGGYYGVLVSGPTTVPYPEQINLINNEVKDFYLYGLYLRGINNSTISGNDIHRLNRTSPVTFYGIYLGNDLSGTTIEGNRIHDPVPVGATSSSAFYGIQLSTAVGSATAPLNITNNAIYNVSLNGVQYGLHVLGASGNINAYHNTIALDNASHTGGSTIANVYATGSYFDMSLKNNLYYINSGSTGTHYHFYSSSTSASPISNHNVFMDESVNGTKVLARLGSQDYVDLVSWQGHGNSFDMNSVYTIPLFVNASAGDLTPQSSAMDNLGESLGILTDILGNTRSTATPDAGAFEFTASACQPPTVVNTYPGSSFMAYDWTGSGTEIGWQYAFGETANGFPTAITTLGATQMSAQITSVSPYVSYDFWVRAICAVGDTSIWFGPNTASTTGCSPSQQCQLSIDLTDTWGDGWNGAVLGIAQNGVVVGTFGPGFTNGPSFGPVLIDVCENFPVEVMVVSPGSYPEEIGFTISGPFGVLYQRQPATFTASTVFATFASPCQPLVASTFNLLTPADGSSITVNAGSPLNLEASWEPMAPAAQYTWMIDAQASDFSAPLATVLANQNGFDTTVTIPYDAIDVLLASNGVMVGDSVTLKWTVVGINGTDTLFATMPFEVNISRAAGVIVYCASNATNTADTKIDSVVIGNFVIGSAQTQCEAYTDHSGLGTVASVDLGQPLNIAIKTGYCGSSAYNARGRAFIDMNHDGDFTADEAVLDFGPMTNTGTGAQRQWFGGDAIIPNYAEIGVTRLRIVYRESAPTFDNVLGCGTYTYGETEDFEIEITQPALTTVQLVLPNDGELRNIVGNAQAVVQADWTPAISATGDPITYHFELEENPSGFGSADLSLLSADNGSSNYIRISYATLDSFMASNGVAIGDTVQYHWSVKVTSGGQTTYAVIPHELLLVRGGFSPLQVVYAPQGTSASTGVRAPNGLPIHNHMRAVMHVSAQEFLDAGLNPGDEVYSMQFNYLNGVDSAAGGFMNVFLQLTNDAVMSKGQAWSDITNDMFIIYSDLVSLPVSTGPASMTLNFPAPFIWDGSSMYVGYDYQAFTNSTAPAVYVANNAVPGSLFSASNEFVTPDSLLGQTSFRPEIGWGKVRKQFDLSLENAYVMQRNLQNNGPEQIYVAIRNNGAEQDSTANLTVNVFGSNVQQVSYVIPPIAIDSTLLVGLQPLSTTDFGFSGVEFTLSPDQNSANDFQYRERDVNEIYQSLVIGANNSPFGSVGFGATEGIGYVRYELGTARQVQAVHAVIGESVTNIGESVYMVIATDSGILASSPPITITQAELGTAQRFDFGIPVPLNAGVYYVGMAQVLSANANAYYPLAVRKELPARPNTYYFGDLAGTSIAPDNFLIDAGLAPMIETEFASNTPPQANFFASEYIAYMGGRNTSVFLQDVSGGNPTSHSWQIQHTDSSISTSTAVNLLSGGYGQPQLEVSFNQPGFYHVSLSVSNALGTSDRVRTGYLFVMEELCESRANSPADSKIDSFAFAGILTGSDPQACEQYTTYSGQNPLMGASPQYGRAILSSNFNNQTKRHVFSGNHSQNGWAVSYDDLPRFTAPLVLYEDTIAGAHLACGAAVNSADLAGKVALIWRGDCQFGSKAYNAQQAGAVGVILVNNTDGAPTNLAGGSMGFAVTIPVALVTDQDGWYLYNEVMNGSAGAVTMGGVDPQHVGQLFIGQQENIAVKPGSCSGNYYAAAGKVYIDYNGNAIFDIDEEVFSFQNAAGFPWVQGTITVPPTAVPGLQRMRVVFEETPNLAGVDACGTYSWGETEEYLVEISGNFPGLTASLPEADLCAGSNSIPVTVSNFVDVGAISMTIAFDPQSLNFTGVSQINPALSGGQVLANAVNGQLGISWFDVNGATSGSDTLFFLDFDVTGTSLLEFDMSPGANEFADAQGNVLMSLFLDGEVNLNGQCNEIIGVVTYDNNSNTPMNNSTVMLMSGGNVVQTATTDASGAFSLSGFPNGVYELTASTAKSWGGVNATDALGIARHFTGAVLLNGIRQGGADVNGNGSINSTDALFVARRFTGQINSFTVGDWIFSNPTVQVSGQPQVQDIKALAFGDVNGSYIPSGARVMPQIFVDQQGSLLVGSEEVKVPVRIDRSLAAGAISLILQMPYGVQVSRVESALAGGEFTYELQQGELRISWFTLDEVSLTEDDVLFHLYLSAPTAQVMGNWVVSGLSEVANGWAEVYPSAGVRIPSIQGMAGGPFDAEVYPNPTADVTNLRIRLPENGKVTVRVVDGLGKTVHLEHGLNLEQGTTMIELDAAKWSAGRYHATVLYELEGKMEMKQLKIQVIR